MIRGLLISIGKYEDASNNKIKQNAISVTEEPEPVGFFQKRKIKLD